MSLLKLHIKNHQEVRVVMGHPWIYSNEIANFSELKLAESGSLVEVFVQKNKNPIAIAYFNHQQLIAARILTHDVSKKIDEYFFIEKINSAKILREKFFDKPFYRLIHSEADSLPGLVIDRFDNVFVCQISTLGMENLKHFLITALEKIFLNCKIIFRNDVESRKFENLSQDNEINALTNIEDEIICIENNLKFSIDVKNGQKTGWFFDQRENRKFISSIAKNCDVLDAFCYQGGFGLNAISGGAKSVVFVDSSKEAIEKIRRNLELNFAINSQKNTQENSQEGNEIKDQANLLKKYEFFNERVFETLEKFAEEKRQFDLIILDPPAFVKSKKDLFAGLRGYEKLVRMASLLLSENGVLFLASCSHNVSLPDLIESAHNGLRKGLAGTNRTARLIRTHGASFDHPICGALKESEYLKSVAFVV